MGLLAAAEAGRRIRAARKGKGLTQAQLAGHCGVAQSLVCYWESGATPVSRDDLPRVCEVLGLELRELLLDEDDPPSPAAVG